MVVAIKSKPFSFRKIRERFLSGLFEASMSHSEFEAGHENLVEATRQLGSGRTASVRLNGPAYQILREMTFDTAMFEEYSANLCFSKQHLFVEPISVNEGRIIRKYLRDPMDKENLKDIRSLLSIVACAVSAIIFYFVTGFGTGLASKFMVCLLAFSFFLSLKNLTSRHSCAGREAAAIASELVKDRRLKAVARRYALNTGDPASTRVLVEFARCFALRCVIKKRSHSLKNGMPSPRLERFWREVWTSTALYRDLCLRHAGGLIDHNECRPNSPEDLATCLILTEAYIRTFYANPPSELWPGLTEESVGRALSLCGMRDRLGHVCDLFDGKLA